MSRNTIAAAILVAATAAGLTAWWLYGEPQPWVLMRNTVLLSLGVCLIAVPLGTCLAISLTRTDLPGRRAMTPALLALLFVPLYLTAAAWDAGFGQIGWYTLVQSSPAEPWLAGWRAAIWIHAMAAIPWVMLLVAAAARHVEASLEEDALLDGTARQVLWHVTLRRLRPALAVAALWVLLGTAAEMTVTDLYRVRTYAEVLYTGFALGDDLSDSAMRVLPGMVAVTWLVVIGFVVAASLAPSFRTPPRPPWIFRLGRWRWLMVIAQSGVLLLLIAVPLGNLVYKAGVTVQIDDGQRQRLWTIAALWETVAAVPWRYGEEFGWTAVLGAVTATAAVALGLPLAWLARRGGWRSVPAVAIAATGLAIPGPLIGLSIIWLLDRPFPPGLIWLYDRTLFAPVLAMLVRTLPITILFGWHVLSSIASDVLDAAACDGAGTWRQFWWIAVPPRIASLLAVWLVAFAVATGDLACSILVVPAGVTTIPIRVFGLLHAGVDDQVAGICLVMLASFFLLAVLVMRLLKVKQRGTRSG
ncbi:MAG: ABC transporter permease subunit [Pirellulaceae bacterium]|nr:ABC transporter permease subunit [Pirellulaceae bacterium]